MTTIKALIFDMDGTLVDSEKIHWQAWKETLALHGLKVPDYGDFFRINQGAVHIKNQCFDRGHLNPSLIKLLKRSELQIASHS